MAKTAELVASLVADQLQPGEGVVAATRVNKKGTIKRSAAMGAGGLIGAAIASRGQKEVQATVAAAGFPDLQQMTLGLTDRRVFVLKNSAMSGKPKELVMTISLADIHEVRFEKGKIVPKLFVTMSNGVEVELEAIKIDHPDEFADALAQRITAHAA